MLTRALIGTLSILALVATAQADPKDDIQAAVQKVADSPSYSWTTTVEGGFGRGPSDGKTEKDGYTSFSITLRDGTKYDIITKDGKSAVKTPDGWKTTAELTADSGDDAGGPPSPGKMIAMQVTNFKTPTAIAKDFDDKLQNIQKTDDGYSADVSPDAVKEMMSRFRRPGAPAPDVKDPKASVNFSIKDGAVTTVKLHVTATVTFNGNDINIDRTTTTDFKDVGTTKVDVPAEAKAKMGA